MNYTEFEDAVIALFNDKWNGENTETALIAYPNQKFEKPDPSEGKTFIEIAIEPTHGTQNTLGSNGGRVFRYSGVLAFSVWVPRDSGTNEINRICAVIERIYMDNSISGTNMHNPRCRRFGDGDNGWFVQGLYINYNHDDIK